MDVLKDYSKIIEQAAISHHEVLVQEGNNYSMDFSFLQLDTLHADKYLQNNHRVVE